MINVVCPVVNKVSTWTLFIRYFYVFNSYTVPLIVYFFCFQILYFSLLEKYLSVRMMTQ